MAPGILLHQIPPGADHLLGDRGVVQHIDYRLRHCRRIARRNKDRGLLVFDDEWNSTYICAYDRHATRERLKDRDRHVVVQAWIDEHVGFQQELRDKVVFKPPRKLDVWSYAELLRQSNKHFPLRSAAGNSHVRTGPVFSDNGERAQCRPNVIEALEITRDD